MNTINTKDLAVEYWFKFLKSNNVKKIEDSMMGGSVIATLSLFKAGAIITSLRLYPLFNGKRENLLHKRSEFLLEKFNLSIGSYS